MERRGFERLKHSTASFAFMLGALGVSACASSEKSDHPEPSTPPSISDIQKELSDWIGKQAGLYDEDGNIIPLEERNLNGEKDRRSPND